MAVSLLSTFYIARTLGPQNFGELSYAQSVIGILALFSALTGTFYRDVIRHPDQENRLLGTAWVVAFIGAFFTSALALLYVTFFSHEQLTIMVIAILCLAQFISPFSIIQNIFYAKAETKWLSITNLSVHILISTFKITAMIAGQGVLVLASIMLLEQALIALSYSFLYKHLHGGSVLKWRFDLPYMKRLVADSFPLMIITATGMISARIDQIFIKHYLDMATVGLYNVAVQLSEVWQFLPGVILAAIFPAIVNGRAIKQSYRRRLFSLAGVFTAYGVALSLFLTLAADPIIQFIYGSSFSGSVILLKIYIWSLTGMILGFLISHFLTTENKRKILVACAIIPMILNILLNFMLIPHYGAAGAAAATVISYSIAPFLLFTFKDVRSTLFSKLDTSYS